MESIFSGLLACVHGDIRHLENVVDRKGSGLRVHGDIRHLEILYAMSDDQIMVHGDIRHLEILHRNYQQLGDVHGDIRHLEISGACFNLNFYSSWRHTPFRKPPLFQTRN